MRRHEHRGAFVRQVVEPFDQPVLPRAVHAAGGFVETGHGRRRAAEHDLKRQPLTLTAREVIRVRVPAFRQARRLQAIGIDLLVSSLVEQVVARVLHQQRDLTAALDATAGRVDEPARQPQERALAGAVAAHQRHPLTGLEPEVDPAQDRGPVSHLEPGVAKLERGGRPPVPPAPPTGDTVALCARIASIIRHGGFLLG